MEKLASIGKVDDFYDAVDADDFAKATSIMKKANIDPETIAIVLKKMREGDDEN